MRSRSASPSWRKLSEKPHSRPSADATPRILSGRMRWWMLVLAGCGRVSFDPLACHAPGVDAAPLALCFEDDFADGDAADWSQDEGPWVIDPTGGPDGWPAWTNTFGNFSRTSHAMLRGVTEAHLAIDFW